MLPSRCRTGTSSNSPSPTWSLISASLGSRLLLQARVQSPLCSACPLRPSTRKRARSHRSRRPAAPPLRVDGASRPR
jgi:hypothetical protein